MLLELLMQRLKWLLMDGRGERWGMIAFLESLQLLFEEFVLLAEG
jgi:hypothetical protein